MPRYYAFLRAVNLGAKRRFPVADLVAATRAATQGDAWDNARHDARDDEESDVRTYLATGNVALTSARRSTDAVAADLEAAYAADRGFDVPTAVLTPAELAEIVRVADEVLAAAPTAPAQVSVTLYARPPSPEAVEAAQAWTDPTFGLRR